MAEFRASGYEATSMDRIAARAGVSKRTVYNHFASKEVLFTRILEALLERGLDGLDLRYRRDVPLRAQLTELVERKLRVLRDPDFVDLARVAIAAAIHSPDMARKMIERLGAREAGLALWVREAAADGRIDASDPVFAAMQLESLIKGFAFWPQMALGQPPLDAAKQAQVMVGAVEIFLARYAPGAEAGA